MLEQELLSVIPKKRKRIFHTLDAFGEYQTLAYFDDIKLGPVPISAFRSLNDNKLKNQNNLLNNPPNYSSQFNQFDNNQNNHLQSTYDYGKKLADETIKQSYSGNSGGNTHKDFSGNSWGKSFEPSSISTKDFNDGSTLHIHSSNGFITGANIRGYAEKKGRPLSNYQASMLDLLPGKKFGDG